MNSSSGTEKKAFYKRPAFWIIIAVVITGIVAAVIIVATSSKSSSVAIDPDADPVTITATDDGRYYAIVNVPGIYNIEVKTARGTGGNGIHADGSPYNIGEKVYLDSLDGYKSFGGVSIKAYNDKYEVLWEYSEQSAPIPSSGN
ncbi:MAG: hypothetical protein HUJ75_03745 [Parasporobacterium sp.]|nr:hypothetical protein [Parasporobacterium sp.]